MICGDRKSTSWKERYSGNVTRCASSTSWWDISVLLPEYTGFIQHWSRSPLSASSPRQLVNGIIRFYYQLTRQSFRLMVLWRRLCVGVAQWGGLVVPRVVLNVTAMRLLHDADWQSDISGSRRVNRTCSATHKRFQSVRRLSFRQDLLLYSSLPPRSFVCLLVALARLRIKLIMVVVVVVVGSSSRH